MLNPSLFQTQRMFLLLLLSTLSGCGRTTKVPVISPLPASAQKMLIPRSVDLQTIYGVFKIEEPVLLDLLASQAMNRLKYIHQHGINDIVKPEYAFSRFDHSVGVFILTRMYGGSIEEQVAALLHDVSHTVFSHVGDLVFTSGNENDHAYQDDIHEWFVNQTDLAHILHRYGMKHVVSEEAKKRFKLLEQEYPDICTDRLDYMLRTAQVTGLLNQQDIKTILQHLHFECGKWFFDDIDAAYAFASASIGLTRYMYAAPWNAYLYKFAADAFKRAMNIGLISIDELHFSTDDVVWNRITNSNDPILQDIVNKINHFDRAYEVTDATNYDYFKKSKCRVVDPLVKVNGSLVRLSSVRDDFAQEYQSIQQYCSNGIYLKFNAIEG